MTLALVRSSQSAEERELFRRTYQMHFKYVWRVLSRLGVPERDLADAAQDVFLVVIRKQADFDQRSRTTTWLYGICFRVASERRRSGRSRYEVLEQAKPAELSGVSDDHLARTTHYRRLLAEALDAMPLEQRAVFAFFELDGMTGEEIAERVGASVATVHSRLRLARGVFRRFVERIQQREEFEARGRGGE